jgi:hypothetical protein
MNDQMPMFDDPIKPAEPSPKKPRQKPMKRRKNSAGAAMRMTAQKKRRKRRTVKPRILLPKSRKTWGDMSMVEFLETAMGLTLAPWQRKVIQMFSEKDK